MDLKRLLLSTVYFSLLMQALTGIVDISVLIGTYAQPPNILRDLLWMETFVQVIESVYYIWLATHFASASDITHQRYYDWFITTPTMLISLCLYLNFLKEGGDLTKHDGIFSKIWELRGTLIPIMVLNAAMLGIGFLGETGIIDQTVAVLLGSIPFVHYFYLIYQEYAKYTDMGRMIFWVFASIWSMYGFAAFLSYYWKNISYNILDLAAKNFFGLFLAYVIVSKTV